ncbi:Serine/threonine-protein kinase pim-2 [Larimichthys crocea]|uniref:non-specific serine/threonine protein kinase n=1 Tax=Larimichthys crocea TaxID=215358 RepID=A0A6G0J4B0_LARCR|nr:Serine/threonine-protein kinase pim-2 [Larimichthys crocea]
MVVAKKFKTDRCLGSKKKSKLSQTIPNIILGQDCMVTRNKRKTLLTMRKKQRDACKHTEVSLEPVKVNGTKRKANSKAETASKKLRVYKINTAEPTKVPVKTESSGSKTTSVTSRDFEAKYQQLNKLGEGGFGAVAIKHIPRSDACLRPRIIKRKKCMIPNEVLLMQRVASGPDSVGKSAAVSLLDWYDLDQEVVLVMERPFPCTDLYAYITGPMDENQAKIIMRQLVEAAIKLHSEGVFHRDIKKENVLLETGSEVPRVRLIDFGCGCFVKKGPYRCFSGTSAYAPPEFFKQGRYEAGPTTVWQLGALLYELLDGLKQFTTSRFMHTRTEITSKLSKLKVSQDLPGLSEDLFGCKPKAACHPRTYASAPVVKIVTTSTNQTLNIYHQTSTPLGSWLPN